MAELLRGNVPEDVQGRRRDLPIWKLATFKGQQEEAVTNSLAKAYDEMMIFPEFESVDLPHIDEAPCRSSRTDQCWTSLYGSKRLKSAVMSRKTM